jgi:hypothetical protein
MQNTMENKVTSVYLDFVTLKYVKYIQKYGERNAEICEIICKISKTIFKLDCKVIATGLCFASFAYIYMQNVKNIYEYVIAY